MPKKYKRWMTESVANALHNRRVVVIAGPRQCGKTTLARQLAAQKTAVFIFRTLDDTTLLKAAQDNPLDFVKHQSGTLVIDEIQKAPELISAIKQVVDLNDAPGQFLLTGSADIQSLPGVFESLAGRIKNIHLRTFAQGEILEKAPNFLHSLFNANFASQIPGYDKTAILQIALRGGYPEAVRLTHNESKDWHLDYIDTLLTRDLKIITNIRRRDSMQDLMETLAAWSSKFIDTTSICGKLALTRATFDSYLNALKALYLFEDLRSWVKTDYDRVGRRDKLFITDTGIMASVLNWQLDAIYFDADRVGKIIETLVFNELSAQISLNRGYSFYHYRDRENREIDFIIENEFGEMACIEVKASMKVSKEDFRHIKWFKENLVKDKKVIGVVLYSGENTVSFGENLLAVPLAALWS